MSTAAQRREPAFRKPNATRAARRRREVIAELVADLGRQPDAAERHLIATIADLTTQREALSAAQMRGEPVDSMALLKIAGLITRAIAALRGKSGGKRRAPAGTSLAAYLASRAAEKAANAAEGEGV